MPVCPNCGAKGEGRYCPSCGAALSKTSAPTSSMPDHAAAAMCYVMGPITGVLFLTLEPYSRNREVRFHAWQAVLFGVAAFLVFLTGPLLSFVLPWSALAVIGLVETAILMLALVAWIALMYKAFVGERWKLPVIGAIAERKA